MRYLSKQDRIDLCVGSSWFGTGGGFPLPLQISRMEALREEIALVSLDELAPDQAVVCAYGVGSAAATEVDLIPAFQKSLAVLSEECRADIAALFPAEIGIESAVCSLAAQLKRPLVDADVVGGRAVPELRQDNCTLLGRSIAPLVACNAKGEILLLKNINSPEEAEHTLRSFASISPGGSVAAVDHFMPVIEARAVLTIASLSRSIALGVRIRDGEDITTLCDSLDAPFCRALTVTRVELISHGGFFRGHVRLCDQTDEQFLLLVKNEYLKLCHINRGVEYTAPDLICLIDPERKAGIHSTELKAGMSVITVIIKATPRWQTAEAKALFQEERNDVFL